jgi:anti-anti-sigma regulatory factor
MRSCPSCGSENVYVHDKGWKFYARLFTFSNRLVCRECRTTWKRNTPQKFAKLKRKSYRRHRKSEKEYELIEPEITLRYLEAEEVSSILAEHQEKKQLFLCLDFSSVKDLSHANIQNLIKLFRRLQVLGGDLVIQNISPKIAESLVVLNLSYLIATNQKITEGQT